MLVVCGDDGRYFEINIGRWKEAVEWGPCLVN
jgi:hypothetical protein